MKATRSLWLVPGMLHTLASAGEALWAIQSLPKDLLQKECGFEPDSAWVSHIQKACIKLTPKGLPGGGSGCIGSSKGLLVTNRHCVTDALAELSAKGRDLLHDGMYAPTQAEELECAMDIHVLDSVMDVTAQVRHDLGPTPKSQDIERIERTTMMRKVPGHSF